MHVDNEKDVITYRKIEETEEFKKDSKENTWEWGMNIEPSAEAVQHYKELAAKGPQKGLRFLSLESFDDGDNTNQ